MYENHSDEQLQALLKHHKQLAAELRDTPALHEELQAHRIELELRNRELKAARAELEVALHRCAELYDLAPASYMTLSRDGVILHVNFTGAELLGEERTHLAGQRFEQFCGADFRERLYSHLNRVIDNMDRDVVDLEICRQNGATCYVRMESQPVEEDGELLCRSVLVDMSQQHQLLQTLEASRQGLQQEVEERTQSLRVLNRRLSEAHNIARLGHWEWNVADGSLFWSDEIYRIFGVDPKVFNGTYDAFIGLVHPDDRSAVVKAIEAALYQQEEYVIQHRIVRPDGEVRFVLERARVDRDEEGRPVEMLGTVQDVTRQEEERRLLEQLLVENRRLGTSCISIQEEERRSIARELHDELGQVLTAIKLDAGFLQNTLVDGGGETGKVLEDINVLVDHAFQRIKGITHRLRPMALDQLGLLDALLELVQEWQQRNRNVEVTFSAPDALQGLSEAAEITLYRALQEGLTNVSRHAAAEHVRIEVGCNGEDVVLRIRDDGRGFDQQNSGDGIGLLGMRERLEGLGGRLILESPADGGVRVNVVLPIEVSVKD